MLIRRHMHFFITLSMHWLKIEHSFLFTTLCPHMKARQGKERGGGRLCTKKLIQEFTTTSLQLLVCLILRPGPRLSTSLTSRVLPLAGPSEPCDQHHVPAKERKNTCQAHGYSPTRFAATTTSRSRYPLSSHF